MPKKNPLEGQIAEARRTISSEGYPISIGELTNLYRDGELDVRPEFQRFFRWTPIQKSRLIESLLLGIPIPSIFVAQTADGTWELVDGLQRVSTILELQGLLEKADGTLHPPLSLEATKFLPGLEGRLWEDNDASKSMTRAQRLDIKRSKIDVKIIKRESSPAAKYDLFQRLNSYGMSFTPQEMRSALLIGVSGEFFSWVEKLSRRQSFTDSVGLSERRIKEKYDLELVLRWLVLHDRPTADLTQQRLRDFSQFLDDESLALAENFTARKDELEERFNVTFDFIDAAGGEDVFRKWDVVRDRFTGAFLNTSFEVFALGVGYHVAQGTSYRMDLLDLVKQFWTDTESGFATGRSTEARMAEFIPLGRELLGV